MILEILSKKEQSKLENDSDATASEKFLYPPRYEFPVECTPSCTNDPLSEQIELTPEVHEVQSHEVEGV